VAWLPRTASPQPDFMRMREASRIFHTRKRIPLETRHHHDR
jgi:hypothetical protein